MSLVALNGTNFLFDIMASHFNYYMFLLLQVVLFSVFLISKKSNGYIFLRRTS